MLQQLVQIALPLALIIIMIGVGLGLQPADFRRVVKHPKAVTVGFVCQLFLLPIVAILLIKVLGLSGELALGLVILSLCPGGTTSNLFSMLARADVGLSVSLTAIVGFITPFTIPLITLWAISFLGLTADEFQLPLIETWVKLMVVGVIPVIVGMSLRHRFPDLATKAAPTVNKIAVTVLCLVVFSICVQLGPKLLDYLLLAGPASLLLNLGTMAIGYGIGRLLLTNLRQARTVCLEVGLQNGTMALMITSGIFASPTMSIVPSVYSLVMFVGAGLFAFAVNRSEGKPLVS